MTSQYLQEAQARVGMTARKWTLDRLLDVGGMASVYVATHRNGNVVAVKVMHRQYAEMAEAKERFLREGYVANKVGHQDAVTVLDDDELDDGTPFIVMELLQGHSLEDRLKQKHVLSPAEIFYIADKLLDVLAAAHAQGIIHRDIKPPNIYLTRDGRVKVLDFGLARVLEAPGKMSMTRTGTIIGTASYMSPEQARGKREMIDHRTDIFAAGAVMFRALTGRNLHMADSPMDRLLAAMTNHAPKVSEVLPDLPSDIAALVDRGLAFQKTDRWPDAGSMQAELRAVYQRHAGAPIPGSEGSQVAAWAEPRPAAAQPTGVADTHVAVSVEELPTGNSIVVEFEDVDSGEKRRHELRRQPPPPRGAAAAGAPVEDDEAPLSEVSIVFDEDG